MLWGNGYWIVDIQSQLSTNQSLTRNYEVRQINGLISKTLNLLTLNTYSNFDMQNVSKSKSQNIKQNTSKSINKMFGEMHTILSLKQPPNLLKLLLLNRKNPQLPQGLFTFKGKNCKLCAFNTKPCIPTSKHWVTLFGISRAT